VAYDIEQNANSVDFEETVIDAEVVETGDVPEFMKE